MSTTRGYRSSLREEQARRTRLLIRQAARELFGQRGFAATTVADIAERAGVSTATVYANYESKAGIVAAMVEELEEGADMARRRDEMLAETDARRQLELWVEAHCALFEGGADVLRPAMQAMQAPEVSALAERGDANRRYAVEYLVSGWEKAGELRAGLSPRDVADQMFLLSTVESFLTAVDRLGWTPERYRAWLTGLLTAEVLRNPPGGNS